MSQDWASFFALQRRLLNQGLSGRGAAEVFEMCAHLLAEEALIESVFWDSSEDGTRWRRCYAWPRSLESTDNCFGPNAVSLNFEEDGMLHRFNLTGSERLEADLCQALASTLKTAVDLKLEMLKHPPVSEQLSERKLGHAQVDLRGNIISADEYFASLIRGAISTWDARNLPFEIPITPQVLKNGVSWRRLYFFVVQKGDHLLLRARPDRRLPKLTPQEIRVIELIASGHTFKQIGAKLEIAPSTASTHLYRAYEKLNISRKSELIGWIKAHPELLVEN